MISRKYSTSCFDWAIVFRKLIKVVQYACVIMSEFNLMKFVIRVTLGRRPRKLEIEEWFKRFKLAGSALSTTRTCLRLCMGIETIGYFLKQLRIYFKEECKFQLLGDLIYTIEKVDSTFNLVINLLNLISGFFDNWYYLGRIGTISFKSDAQSTLISRCGTVPTIMVYTMELWKEIQTAAGKG